MKVVITGSRNWTKQGPIQVLLAGMQAQGDVEFVLGDAPAGVDAYALQICREKQYSYKLLCADWTTHTPGCRCRDTGPGSRAFCAGHRRNGEMIAYAKSSGQPVVCYGIRSEGISRGTDDCLKQAGEAGIPCYLIRQIPPPV